MSVDRRARPRRNRRRSPSPGASSRSSAARATGCRTARSRTSRFEPDDGVWQAIFALPAGSWEYKAALDGTWDENYGAGAVRDGPNIAFALAGAAPVKFFYDDETHWVTDNVTSVIATVPGSFQSELGCAGDWDPACLRSWLQDPDGDGIGRFSTSILPPGTYEAKVAIDEAWDENYGAGGTPGGANIAFTVASAGDTASFSYDQSTHALDIAVTPAEPVDDAALVRAPLRHPFVDEVLYFAIPDRFNDGNRSNNCGDYAGVCLAADTQEHVLTHGYLPSDKGYYHGGDIEGLRQKLPYLRRLGVTTIWVGPIFANNTTQPDSSDLYGHSAGYHGYWIKDFLKVDPHLGTNAEFARLVDEAHDRNMKVVMDIVTNHTADVIQLEGNAGYRNKRDFPYRDVNGQPFDDSDYAYAGQSDYTFPEVDAGSFPYTPTLPAGDENAKNPAWLNDPLLYHNRGDTSFTGENSLYGDFFGLDDLWTERREVVQGMIDIYSFWINEFGVDGFRIDTTKHVNMEFWQVFGPEILAAAKARGIDGFFAFGEVFDQQFGPQFLSEFSTRGRLQSTIDFGFQLAARGFASQSAPTANLRDFFALDDYYTDADSNAYAMPTFLGNHDMGRIGYFLQRVDQPGADDAELLARSRLAHALMFFARGQPVVYYGDEQGFVGDGGDKDAREDMFANTVPSYADNDLIGTDETSADDNFDRTHPLFETIGRLAKLARDYPALRSGAQVHRYSSDGPGVYAFSRIDRDERTEYVVALNNSEAVASAHVPTYSPAGVRYRLLSRNLSNHESVRTTLTTGVGGDLAVTVPPLGFVVYQARTPVPASTAAPGITITSLQPSGTAVLGTHAWDGQQVTDRIEVAARARFRRVRRGHVRGPRRRRRLRADRHRRQRAVPGVLRRQSSPRPRRHPADLPRNRQRPVGSRGRGRGGQRARRVRGSACAADPLRGHPLRADPRATTATTRPATTSGASTSGATPSRPRRSLTGPAPSRSSVRTSTAGSRSCGSRTTHCPSTSSSTGATRRTRTTAPIAASIPATTPEIWLRQGDMTIYTSQAEAQGHATVHYACSDCSGVTIDASNDSGAVATNAPPDAIDDYGAVFTLAPTDLSSPLTVTIRNAGVVDIDGQLFTPIETPSAWFQAGEQIVYASRGAAEDFATIHYRRPAGDYGDPTSADFNDFWGAARVDRRGDGDAVDRPGPTDRRGRVRRRVPGRPDRRRRPARLHPAPGRHEGPRTRPVPRLRNPRPRGLAAPGRGSGDTPTSRHRESGALLPLRKKETTAEPYRKGSPRKLTWSRRSVESTSKDRSVDRLTSDRGIVSRTPDVHRVPRNGFTPVAPVNTRLGDDVRSRFSTPTETVNAVLRLRANRAKAPCPYGDGL